MEQGKRTTRKSLQHNHSRRKGAQRRADPRILRGIRYGLAAVCMLLAVSVFFRIADVQVTGNVLYSETEILSAAAVEPGSSLLLTRRAAVEERICRILPCVEDARVILRLPDTVVLRVRELPAAAVLEWNGKTVQISGSGRVVGFGAAEGLVPVRGFSPSAAELGVTLALGEGDSGKLDYLAELLELLEQKGLLAQVQEIDLSSVSDLRFRYEDRFTVRMGRQESLSYKLDFMCSIVRELGYGEAGILDMSSGTEGHYVPG